MDAITRQKLEALLASLPTAADREALAQEFSHSSTPAADRQTPEAHAAAVVAAFEAHPGDLRAALRALAEQHPALRARANQVAALLVDRSVADEEDEPTEMIDPALLATLRTAGTPQLGNRKTLPAPAPPLPAASTPQRPATSPPARAPKLPRGGGTPVSPPRRQVSSGALAAGILVLLVTAAAAGFAVLQ